jgi:hypothetical protein
MNRKLIIVVLPLIILFSFILSTRQKGASLSADTKITSLSPAPSQMIAEQTPQWCQYAAPISPTVITLTQLKNLTYTPEEGKKTTLINGEGRFPLPGFGLVSLYLVDACTAYGDVNNDGKEDAIIVLGQHADGTTGSWYQLVAVINRSNRPVPLAYSSTNDLGDRAIIQSIIVQNGVITVAATTHGPDDPLCCPTFSQTLRYIIMNNKLIKQ